MTPEAELLAAAIAILTAAFLVCLAVFVLAMGAKTWSDAVAATHRARSHGAQADAEETTLGAAQDAVDEVKRAAARAPYVPPSDDELIASLVAERGSTNGKAHHEPEFTTEGNEGIEEAPPIYPDGGFYRS